MPEMTGFCSANVKTSHHELGGFLQVPRENTHHEAIQAGSFVVQTRCDALYRVSQGQELRLPSRTFGTFRASELIQGGVTDLTADDFAVVQHREFERQPFGIVTDNFSAGERHCVLPTGGPPTSRLSVKRPTTRAPQWVEAILRAQRLPTLQDTK